MTIQVVRTTEVVQVIRKSGAATQVVQKSGIAQIIRNARGPAGANATDHTLLIRLASGAISGHRVVKAVSSTQVGYPNTSVAEDSELILGITTGAAIDNAVINIQSQGEIYEPSWSWSLGPVFCGTSGTLVQSPPVGAWIRQVGVAIATDRLIVQLRPSILTP